MGALERGLRPRRAGVEQARFRPIGQPRNRQMRTARTILHFLDNCVPLNILNYVRNFDRSDRRTSRFRNKLQKSNTRGNVRQQRHSRHLMIGWRDIQFSDEFFGKVEYAHLGSMPLKVRSSTFLSGQPCNMWYSRELCHLQHDDACNMFEMKRLKQLILLVRFFSDISSQGLRIPSVHSCPCDVDG